MTRKILLLAAGLVSVAVFALIGFALYRYLDYRASQGGTLSGMSTTRVSVLSPLPQTQHSQGSPVVIDVYAGGPDVISTVELWIDGELAGRQLVEGEASVVEVSFV